MPKRLQNQLRLGYSLGTPKNTICDVKTSPRWLPKISVFFKNRLKIVAMTVFGPRCLLEASKNLLRASQEPPKSRPRALERPSKPLKSLPWGPQKDSKSLLCRPFNILGQKSRRQRWHDKWDLSKQQGRQTIKALQDQLDNSPSITCTYIYTYIYTYKRPSMTTSEIGTCDHLAHGAGPKKEHIWKNSASEETSGTSGPAGVRRRRLRIMK